MFGSFKFDAHTLSAMADCYRDCGDPQIIHCVDWCVYLLNDINDFEPGELDKVCKALNSTEVKRIAGVNLNDALKDTIILAFLFGMLHAENLRTQFLTTTCTLNHLKKCAAILVEICEQVI